jgi:beta-galactosidase
MKFVKNCCYPAIRPVHRYTLIFFFLLSLMDDLAAQRQVYNFNPGWFVHTGDVGTVEAINLKMQAWKKVTLPHAWNEDDAFAKDIVDLRTGIAWYYKKFRLPKNVSSSSHQVFIEFEGVRQAADIYVNGKHIGYHENGITAFGFNINTYLHTGENEIAVRTNNDWEYKERATHTKYQWSDKNFNANYGGIPKNVRLHITGKIYQTLPLYSSLGTEGTYVYASNINVQQQMATINAHSQVINATARPQNVCLEVSIKEKNGAILKTFTGTGQTILPGDTIILKEAANVSGLQFWSWGFGYLYDVETRLLIDKKIIDKVITTTGFRKTAFKQGMIYLNERVIMIHGYAQRTSNEWPAIGMSVPAWLSDYSNNLMIESGGNLVRWMHTTPWKQDVESCDRVGLMQAMPAGDAEKDVTGRRWEQRKEVMRDAVIYNRNSPSIIFYESGNESISEEHMLEMVAIRNQYDPYGGRVIGSREMLDSKTAEYGGEMLYINKSAHIPMWAMEYSRDEGSRRYWDAYSPPYYHKDGAGPLYKGQDASAYNRNQDSHARENVTRWYEYFKVRPGTGNRVSAGGVNIVFSETNTHYRGEDNYRRSGEVDALRIPKEGFYAHQIMWDGWVNPDTAKAHLIGHWNYEAGTIKDIYAVSSAHKTVLEINGKKISEGIRENGFWFTFPKIQFEPGTISVIGYDKNQREVCRATKHTSGKPAALRLTPVQRPNQWKADGHDLSLVEVEVVDAAGNRVPIAHDTIQFTLTGPAEWRGGMGHMVNNGILSYTLPVEAGVNRVLIRSTTTPGTININATAKGLKNTELKLHTIAVKQSNGLATELTGSDLPFRVTRGATPSTPSYSNTKRELPVTVYRSGANFNKAINSIDDNELSEWSNDGKLSTAWIEYHLENVAQVDEVSIKLSGFRSKIYPLEITVDGKTIFDGNTETTLGYFTIPCKQERGKIIRIALKDPIVRKEETIMKELNGQQLTDGTKTVNTDAQGKLSIIEVSFLQHL